MKRTKLKPISDMELSGDMSVRELSSQMLSSGGFTAKKLGL
ncbi:MAG: hypothetical protein QG582_1071, partial [Candidatus Thermoplasmatota archaeon]|nr:hypothetical protein [Candidatus Thermoplasmatota archaeon]